MYKRARRLQTSPTFLDSDCSLFPLPLHFVELAACQPGAEAGLHEYHFAAQGVISPGQLLHVVVLQKHLSSEIKWVTSNKVQSVLQQKASTSTLSKFFGCYWRLYICCHKQAWHRLWPYHTVTLADNFLQINLKLIYLGVSWSKNQKCLFSTYEILRWFLVRTCLFQNLPDKN